MNINKKTITSIAMVTTLIAGGSMPAYGAMKTLKVDGMQNVASSLQNFIKYVGIFFIAAGAMTAFYGAYKLFQSIKSQDSESRSNSILEIASGLGAIAVGTGASIFSSYIRLV